MTVAEPGRPRLAPSMQDDFADPHWFPVDLHVPEHRYAFLKIDEGVLDRSAFLDTRIDVALDGAQAISVDAIPAILPSYTLAWLFHTSFCCSTLLARALHLPPTQVALKEPLVLRRLGDARHARWSIESMVAPTVSLLARPWTAEGAVIVKPTHAALNVAIDLMDAAPHSRAVILTSSLEDFLVSNVKKTPETQAKIPQLAERALQAGSLHSRLTPAALQPPNLLCAAALQWAAQRELAAQIVRAAGSDRVRILDAEVLLADIPATVNAVSNWLRLPATHEALETRSLAVSRRNAKATESPYDPDRRAEDVRRILAHYTSALRRARQWAERLVLPKMDPEALTPATTW